MDVEGCQKIGACRNNLKNEYKKGVEKARKKTFWEKRLHGKFVRNVSGVAEERSWEWL